MKSQGMATLIGQKCKESQGMATPRCDSVAIACDSLHPEVIFLHGGGQANMRRVAVGYIFGGTAALPDGVIRAFERSTLAGVKATARV